jgi:4,5-DOPA dioxygenase extradiol
LHLGLFEQPGRNGLFGNLAVRNRILSGDHDAIVRYEALREVARLAVPTTEHFLPLLYVLAVQEPNDPVGFFADRVTLGAISMRSVRIG